MAKYQVVTDAEYTATPNLGAENKSGCPFWIIFFVSHDKANAVSDFGILFFANRQLFLKFSKIDKKKLNLKHFSCIFPYREMVCEIGKKFSKNASEGHIYG